MKSEQIATALRRIGESLEVLELASVKAPAVLILGNLSDEDLDALAIVLGQTSTPITPCGRRTASGLCGALEVIGGVRR